MAHSFDTSLYSTNATFDYTCGAGTTLLVLGIYAFTGTRTGADPTYGGVGLKMLGQAAFDYGEGSAELWYLSNPSTGSAYSITMGNSTTRTLALRASSYKAQSGYTSIYDTSLWTNTTGANPSHTINCSTGGVIVQICGHELSSLPSAYSDARILPVDHGTHNSWMQYKISPSNGNNTLSATQSSDEYVLITASFKEEYIPSSPIEWGGILKYYNGAEWTECPSNNFKIYLNSTWQTCPSTKFMIYRTDKDPSNWYPIRFQG